MKLVNIAAAGGLVAVVVISAMVTAGAWVGLYVFAKPECPSYAKPVWTRDGWYCAIKPLAKV